MPDAPAAVTLEHVSFAFDEHVVLRDISFSVPAGSMRIVLGASGFAAITAALAASAQIGTSLTQRGRVRTFTLATPRSGDGESESHWADAFADVDAGALYMGLARRSDVAEHLIAAGKPASTCCGNRGSKPGCASSCCKSSGYRPSSAAIAY